ncbi:MAG: type III pantothenate kinase [Paludibacter sp.]|nr:type III pantothenate kinase [Paludibacter sp.]
MNLCIDQGNTSTKIGVFDQDVLIETAVFDEFGENELSQLFTKFPINASILSSVRLVDQQFLEYLKSISPFFIELSHDTSIPVVNAYETPETLGKDRLAAVVGASFLKQGNDILVIDAGTAVTYDFVDSNSVYHGGNIAPGLNMRLRAMHDFTQKLPLVEPVTDTPMLGKDTQSALAAGALNGIIFEIEGYINHLKIKYPQLLVFLTGGSTFYFISKLKNAIFAERNLVLIGLNRILQYNVQK